MDPAQASRSRDPKAAEPSFLRRWLRLWFSLSEPVHRKQYLLSGAGLMAFKYAVEATLIHQVTGRWFTPLQYFSPLLRVHERILEWGPPALMTGLVLWTLPFLWIGVSMSMRRAVDAGWSPWSALLFFVPVLNYVLMLCLGIEASRGGRLDRQDPETKYSVLRIKSALLGIAAGAGIAVLMMLFNVYVLRSYGSVLFLGTPVLIGAVSSYVFNRAGLQSLWASVCVGALANLMAATAILLFALEGILCVAMAAPIGVVLGLMGALIGRMLARSSVRSLPQALLFLFLVPLGAGVEKITTTHPVFEVMTKVEIDAPAKVVWRNVVAFAEIVEPPGWWFRTGVAYPVRARLDDEGVGAIRHCEFSTGAFVEPITCWDPPKRLAFDVRSQPPCMHEWSPYRHLHPPHLEGTMTSQRGEFLLIEIAPGRTRLEGRTWYQLDLHPRSYWRLWSDLLVHSIHRRVLEHIEGESEGGR